MKKEKMLSILTTSPCIYAWGNNYELRTTNYELERSDLTLKLQKFLQKLIENAMSICSRGDILVTNNIRDFINIPGLQLENWLADEE